MTTTANNDYLAQPPSTCCLVGSLHKGTPAGKIDDIIGVPTYIAEPNASTANGHVVLYFPDVMGLSDNAKLMMDGFASAGFLTLGMDYFRGDPVTLYRKSKDDPLPAGFNLKTWRDKHWAFATKNVPKWTAAVKAKFGNDQTRYACTGYCFGAPFVCDMLALEEVSAGAFAHPTSLTQDHFSAIKKPILLSCAENDERFPTEDRRQAIDILQKHGKAYHLQLFQGVGHGFATKCDLSDPYQRWCKEQSLRAMIEWFEFWLKRD